MSWILPLQLKNPLQLEKLDWDSLDNVWDEKPLMSGGTIMDGEPILSLPPKSTELRKVELSKEEVDFYKALEKETRGFYKKKETAGMVNKDFKEVLARLMRFRQACNHPLLVSSGLPCTSSSAEIARNLPYGSSKLKATLEILSDGSSFGSVRMPLDIG
ncbi:hypothetical protein Bca52824_079275 [Brassica carinata]|uniref:SNF2 N-terminal domain-containing protein n=1 Tax=Brassica carinata TaxID=52824 RepID=A0A8X7U0J5_BRACI|nr:hypothetical protein Bca52824_079275 [Brassica carinata]